MKKLLSIILTLLPLITLIGCAKPADKKDESSKAQETLVVEKTESIKKTQADEQVTVAEGVAQVSLSAEDKAVKEEIAKYNPNAADFRNKKQEKIGDITYDLTFATVGYNKTDKEKMLI